MVKTGKTGALLPEKEPAVDLPPYKQEWCFSSLQSAMGFISVNVVRKLEMIPIAPDGTVQMGAHILTSEDAGVAGTLFEN